MLGRGQEQLEVVVAEHGNGCAIRRVRVCVSETWLAGD